MVERQREWWHLSPSSSLNHWNFVSTAQTAHAHTHIRAFTLVHTNWIHAIQFACPPLTHTFSVWVLTHTEQNQHEEASKMGEMGKWTETSRKNSVPCCCYVLYAVMCIPFWSEKITCTLWQFSCSVHRCYIGGWKCVHTLRKPNEKNNHNCVWKAFRFKFVPYWHFDQIKSTIL